jgi:hypothetical protein
VFDTACAGFLDTTCVAIFLKIVVIACYVSILVALDAGPRFICSTVGKFLLYCNAGRVEFFVLVILFERVVLVIVAAA